MRLALPGLLLAAAVFLITGLGLGAASATAAAGRTAPPRVAPALTVASPAPVLAAFRSRLGFSSRTRYGYPRRSPSLLHRVVKTAIWLYVLHLFFSHGGLSIILWFIIIGLGLSLLQRRRRRRASRPRSFWP